MPTHPDFSNLTVVSHPLIHHKVSQLRNKHTEPKIFRELIQEITLLLGFEATRQLATELHPVETPLETVNAPQLSQASPVIVPILLAGLGMVDSLLALMPQARVGHIGLYRQETTLTPHTYYCKLPPREKGQEVFICDPMLATGGSAVNAITLLKNEQFDKICLLNIVSAPEGVAHLLAEHPDVTIYTAALDRQLNEAGYILPGLGDAGDRLYGTK